MRSHALFTATARAQNAREQALCIANGAVYSASARKCQCVAWGVTFDEGRYTFAVPSVPSTRPTAGQLRTAPCPRLERGHCSCWSTQGGGCGLFAKGASWEAHAFAHSQKDSRDRNECWWTCDVLIKNNRDKVFRERQCGGDIAIKKGNRLRFWSYDPATGDPRHEHLGGGATPQVSPQVLPQPVSPQGPRPPQQSSPQVVIPSPQNQATTGAFLAIRFHRQADGCFVSSCGPATREQVRAFVWSPSGINATDLTSRCQDVTVFDVHHGSYSCTVWWRPGTRLGYYTAVSDAITRIRAAIPPQ